MAAREWHVGSAECDTVGMVRVSYPAGRAAHRRRCDLRQKSRRSLSSPLLFSTLLTERNDRVEYVFVFAKLVDPSCITRCHVVGGP